MATTFSPSVMTELENRGISVETINQQLEHFKNGFPYLRLAGSATVGNGIMKLDDNAIQAALKRWERYLADGGSVTKFVPASGAASRMFKALFAFVNGDSETPEQGSDVEDLIKNIQSLPFSTQLDTVLKSLENKDLETLLKEKKYKTIIKAIISPEGMNYGNLPKGLLTFHRYEDKTTRTPLEEHMVEGALTAATNGTVNLHFTVSGAHRELFKKKINEVKPTLENKFGLRYNIGISEQKPSTDTVAADMDNKLFYDDKGHPVFRPGGHGALIENLGDIDSTVVFIKNIDNIVPDNEREDTILYKKVLAGVLIETHDIIVEFLDELNNGRPTRQRLQEMIGFLEKTLCTYKEGMASLDDTALINYLKEKFNRPMRVCGMVINEGEPGGGPYLAYNRDGSYSPQILESSQINKADNTAMDMMSRATHFNPVDLVCYIKDPEGKPYDLKKYVDPDTGFISQKSLGGRDLKALELPGLWNGAMSDWSTIFIEVPASTFNPVKTVNDLLRPVHQADK
ncbi:MAG: DUF4301 family protein [Muribaculaceae bacterium]|nr:DUF4301 family protein [Muribaculaceae bacterium]